MHICARKHVPQAQKVHPNRRYGANGCTFAPGNMPLVREKYIQIEGKWQIDVHHILGKFSTIYCKKGCFEIYNI